MADLSKLVNELSNLTVLEAAELAKVLEKKWQLDPQIDQTGRGTVVAKKPDEVADTKLMQMLDFISEEEVGTFEGWLKYQGIETSKVTADELVKLRSVFEGRSTTPKVGLMKLKPTPGEYRYGVVVRDGSDLYLTLWVRRSPKGEFFVMQPRGDSDWNPYTSYHLDGTRHMKSHGGKFFPEKRQPLTNAFRGTENLGAYAGHGPKTVGARCDPGAFSGIVEAVPGVLGPRNGQVVVDIVEPGCEPTAWPGEIVQQKVFADIVPGVVIRIVRS